MAAILSNVAAMLRNVAAILDNNQLCSYSNLVSVELNYVGLDCNNNSINSLCWWWVWRLRMKQYLMTTNYVVTPTWFQLNWITLGWTVTIIVSIVCNGGGFGGSG